MSQNYYQILELDLFATEKEIKKAYHKLALKYHPDKNNNSKEQFLQIKEAYDFLSDGTKKQKYDLELKNKEFDFLSYTKTLIDSTYQEINPENKVYVDLIRNIFQM